MTDFAPSEHDLLPQPEAVDDRRPRGSVVALIVAIVVLLGAGGFAVAYLRPDANTPEDAVRALADAVAHEDVLGALDALAPSERRLVRDTVVDVTDELRRLEILSDDADLSGVGGIDLGIDDLELSSRALGDGVSLVDVRGTSTVRLDPAHLPLGSFVEEQVKGAGGSVGPVSESKPIEGLQLVTVEEGGRWYVSLFYSVADAIRRSSGRPAPDFAHGLQADGAASPEKAVRALVDAGIAFDVRRAIALLPPDEGAALQDYAPLFLDEAEDGVAEAKSSVAIDMRRLDLSVDRDGDEAFVTVDRFEVRATMDGEQQSVAFDGKCFTIEVDGDEEQRQCGGAGGAAAAALIGPFGRQGGLDQASFSLGVVTVERDGKWYVSPIRTVLRPLVEALRGLEKKDLDSFLDAFTPSLSGSTETSELSSSGLASDREVQSELRNALTAYKVAFTDAGAWPTDVEVVRDIEPSVLLLPDVGVIAPYSVTVAVDGDVLRLAGRSRSGCFYLADDTTTVSYAQDPGCGPLATQRYGPSW